MMDGWRRCDLSQLRGVHGPKTLLVLGPGLVACREEIIFQVESFGCSLSDILLYASFAKIR